MSLKFISAIVGVAWHGWLLTDAHFTCALELEANDSTKLPIMQTNNNPINIFLIIQTLFYIVFFIKYLSISKITLTPILS